jgi:hypothetical protein
MSTEIDMKQNFVVVNFYCLIWDNASGQIIGSPVTKLME